MQSESVQCPRCGERHSVPLELAPGKMLRVRCPGCAHRFVLRRSATPPPAAAAEAAKVDEGPRDAVADEERFRRRRARRLARALVHGILSGRRERRDRALAEGKLLLEFGDEIRTAWQSYQAKAGRDLARRTSYFQEALNEILADGQKLF